jgi:putative hydrolase of HD superfamily
MKKEYKSKNPILLFPDNNFPEALRVIIESYHLANIYRAGWLESGRDIPKELCESVAEHTIGMRYIMRLIKQRYAMQIRSQSGNNLDWNKVSDMIDIHDFYEIKSGDISPADKVSKERKYDLESRGLYNLLACDKFPETLEDFELWKEYEENKTQEALFTHDVDYFQMIVRARLYELLSNGDHLKAFYEKREEKIHFRIFLDLFKFLLK